MATTKKKTSAAKRNRRVVYMVEIEDLTGVGGPMGTERVTSKILRLFTAFPKARLAVEADHSKRTRKPLPKKWWRRESARRWSSEDLGSHMYVITKFDVF
jgi:hypothetical protein